VVFSVYDKLMKFNLELLYQSLITQAHLHTYWLHSGKSCCLGWCADKFIKQAYRMAQNQYANS